MDFEEPPTEIHLQRIRGWPPPDWQALMDYVKDIWWMPEWGWSQRGRKIYISTGGWSGNEAIIGALQDNTLFWSLCWEETRRGGHFIFDMVRGESVKS